MPTEIHLWNTKESYSSCYVKNTAVKKKNHIEISFLGAINHVWHNGTKLKRDTDLHPAFLTQSQDSAVLKESPVLNDIT